jgi:hypothetical protein
MSLTIVIEFHSLQRIFHVLSKHVGTYILPLKRHKESLCSVFIVL